MGVPTSEVGYTPAMPRREDHEVHKGHVVALEKEKPLLNGFRLNLVLEACIRSSFATIPRVTGTSYLKADVNRFSVTSVLRAWS